MALRDQPYIPLYVQDLMTDEKLNNCCASTHGIYIKGLMCLMHKSEHYGKILLQQKFKQTDKQSKNFAIMLVKHLPYSQDEIENAIDELIEENVCYFEDDFICQKRMVKDGEISLIRSKVGQKGGKKTKENNEKLLKNLPKQNMKQNTENENENVIESEIIDSNSSNIIICENQKKSNFESEQIISEEEQKQNTNETKIKKFKDAFIENDLNGTLELYKDAKVKEKGIKDALNDYCLNLITGDQKSIPYKYVYFKQWFLEYLKNNRQKYVYAPKLIITHIDPYLDRQELHSAFNFDYRIPDDEKQIIQKIKDGIIVPNESKYYFNQFVESGQIEFYYD